MKTIGEAIVTLLLAIIGIAVLSVILGSPNTSSVLNTTFSGLTALLNAATAPAMGNTTGGGGGTTQSSSTSGSSLIGLGTGTGVGTNFG